MESWRFVVEDVVSRRGIRQYIPSILWYCESSYVTVDGKLEVCYGRRGTDSTFQVWVFLSVDGKQVRKTWYQTVHSKYTVILWVFLCNSWWKAGGCYVIRQYIPSILWRRWWSWRFVTQDVSDSTFQAYCESSYVTVDGKLEVCYARRGIRQYIPSILWVFLCNSWWKAGGLLWKTWYQTVHSKYTVSLPM